MPPEIGGALNTGAMILAQNMIQSVALGL